MENILYEQALEYTRKLFSGNFNGHDFNHSFRVHKTAMYIARFETCNLDIVALGSILHDADDHKLFHTKNNQNARIFLESHNISSTMADEICQVINSISFSQNEGRKPSTMEGKIIQDADRLDAIGAIGIARAFTFNGEKHLPMEQAIEHYQNKLSLLKDLMNTDVAKKIAQHRHELMQNYFQELSSELFFPN